MNTRLTIKDFGIIYSLVVHRIGEVEVPHFIFVDKTEKEMEKERQKHIENLKNNIYYQDLLKIRDNLESIEIIVKNELSIDLLEEE